MAEIDTLKRQFQRLTDTVEYQGFKYDKGKDGNGHCLLAAGAFSRREKHAPLLKRASELFTILTGGSFRTLQAEVNANGRVQLVGILQNGPKVPISGGNTARRELEWVRCCRCGPSRPRMNNRRN
jgi:hypothetical protein